MPWRQQHRRGQQPKKVDKEILPIDKNENENENDNNDDESDLYVGFPTSRNESSEVVELQQQQEIHNEEELKDHDKHTLEKFQEDNVTDGGEEKDERQIAQAVSVAAAGGGDDESEDDDETVKTNSTSQCETPNILQDLAKCSWESLDKHIKRLQVMPDLVISSLSVTDPNDYSTPIHVGSWKAPPTLANSLIELLPTDSRESKGVLLACDRDGNTALHLCAANLQPNVVEETRHKVLFDVSVLLALAHKAQDAITMQNAQGDTPVHLLVTTSYSKPLQEKADNDCSLVHALSTLIELNPSVCLVTDSTGATPLHSAIAANAHINILQTILEACTAASLKEDKVGMLPLHYVAAFAKTPPPFIDALVSANTSALTHQTNNGDTPLHLAISNANTTLIQNGKLNKESLKILSAIIDKHISPDDSPLFILNKEKLTPLHCCALFDAPSALTRLLMKHPLGPKAAAMANSFGATALHLAAAQPGVAVSISSITALGTPEAAAVQDRLRRTALHVASQNVHATGQLIQALVKLNPTSASIPTQRGHLPLHLSAQSQAKEQVVKELIKAYREGAQEKNKSGNMPLHDACKYKASPTVVKLILDAYPDAIYAQNNNGYLPLHCAAAYKASSTIIQILLDKYPDGAAIQCKSLDTPLHFVASTSKPSAEIIKMILKAAPSSILITNANDENPLDKAKISGSKGEHITILENSMNNWTS